MSDHVKLARCVGTSNIEAVVRCLDAGGFAYGLEGARKDDVWVTVPRETLDAATRHVQSELSRKGGDL